MNILCIDLRGEMSRNNKIPAVRGIQTAEGKFLVIDETDRTWIPQVPRDIESLSFPELVVLFDRFLLNLVIPMLPEYEDTHNLNTYEMSAFWKKFKSQIPGYNDSELKRSRRNHCLKELRFGLAQFMVARPDTALCQMREMLKQHLRASGCVLDEVTNTVTADITGGTIIDFIDDKYIPHHETVLGGFGYRFDITKGRYIKDEALRYADEDDLSAKVNFYPTGFNFWWD